MGEILRAVLEKNCLKSRVATYGSERTYGPFPSNTHPTLTGNFRVRANTHFLMTGVCMAISNYDPTQFVGARYMAANLGPPFGGPSGGGWQSTTLTLRDLDNSEEFYESFPLGSAPQATSVCMNPNQPLDWEEYRYFAPSRRCGWTVVDNWSNFNVTAGQISTLTLTFFGVEYLMKVSENGQASPA